MTVNVSKPAINVREKLAELDKPTGIAGEAMLRAETPQEQQALIGVGRRNVLINGDFSISQRASYSSATSIASGDYCVDRWKANQAFNIQRFTNADVLGTNTNYVRMSYSNNSNMGFSQYIEDLNWKHMLGKECTFSAYVRTNYSESGLRYYDGQQNYGPRFIADEQWHKVTWTFTLRTGATTLGFLFDSYNNGSYQNGAASGDYIDIALVQLELGKVATPFEHRSYGEELALCQRYYQTIGGGDLTLLLYSAAADNYYIPVSYNTPMRANPTKSISASLVGSATTSYIFGSGVEGCYVGYAVGSTAGRHGINSATITLNAEL
jgi:hypothetical protein